MNSKFSIMVLFLSSLPFSSFSVSTTEKIIPVSWVSMEEGITLIDNTPTLYLIPQKTDQTNPKKEIWLENFKISTINRGDYEHLYFKSFNKRTNNETITEMKRYKVLIHLLILTQQPSMIRPRIMVLKLLHQNEKLKPNRIEYYYTTNKRVLPILLDDDKISNNSVIINLDNQIDFNYRKKTKWLIDNKSTSIILGKNPYNDIKSKINFKVLYIYSKKKLSLKIIREYNVKIYLTTDRNHFDFLSWTPYLA